MMTPPIAMNTVIKPALIKNFGVALSTLIILQNSRKCNLLIASLDREGYEKLIEKIISDYRVMKTLGSNSTAIKKKEWLSLIEY